MRQFVWIGLLLGWLPQAWAHQVCTDKATGRLLEYQSAATPGTCTANAVSSGILAEAVEEREVTDAEWAVIREEHIDRPVREQQATEQARVNQVVADREAKTAALEARLAALESVPESDPTEESTQIPVTAFGAGIAGALTALGIRTITGRKKKETG